MRSLLLRARSSLPVTLSLAAAAGLGIDTCRADGVSGAAAEKVAANPFPRRHGAAAVAGEPRFTRAQVLKNDGVDGRPMWITYRDGVYNVTKFHEIHPGGDLIKQAAGADVSVFWDYWGHHHHAPSVGKYLEQLRIGALTKEDQIDDVASMGEGNSKENDPYQAEPVRNRSFHTVFMERPWSSETLPDVLEKEGYLTSSEALYVRNHAPVPDCAWVPEGESESAYANNHEVSFEVNGGASSSMTTVAELKTRFGTETVTSILQCAGNRASEDIAATGPSGFNGTPFEHIKSGMVGNAEWTGIALSKVLSALYPSECKAALKDDEEYHVVFEGADGYSASTPLSRVLSRENGCLLVTEMNGKALSPDHGYPLRAFVPGVAGARSVKWLESVKLQKGPVDAPWNSYYYKDASAAQIQGLPLQSLIFGASRTQKKTSSGSSTVLSVTGVAYGGGSGNSIEKVEVSTDEGRSWSEATLKMEEKTRNRKHRDFGWVRWEAEVPAGAQTVCCRATDSASVTQPRISSKQRGYLFNGWSKFEIAAK